MIDKPEIEDQSAILARAERLREALNRAGSAAVVAKRIGMAATTISNYVAGRDMKASALIALADGCNVSLEWLATGRGTMNGSPGTGIPGFDDSMADPANFFQLCMLLWHGQEYFRGIGHSPSLADALQWVGPLYPKVAKFPDRSFKIVLDEPLP